MEGEIYTEIFNLPEEIIVEIVYNLPAKSLLKFKCVSKSWYSLISSPDFIKNHLKKSSSTTTNFTHHKLILSFYQPQHNLRSCSLQSLLDEPNTSSMITTLDHYPMRNPNHSIRILGSCNGLICIAINRRNLLLWNPSTRKAKKLPGFIAKLKYNCHLVYGFGYDEQTDDYKVACIFYYLNRNGPYETEIYSSRADSWKKTESYYKDFPGEDSGKFVNGRLHWVVEHGGSWEIVSLHTVEERYEVVAQPDYHFCDYDDDRFRPTMGVLKGYLSLLCCNREVMDVWIMTEYGVTESWIKIRQIPCFDDPRRCVDATALWLSTNGDIVLVFGSIIAVYDGKHEMYKSRVDAVDAVVEANVYVESLVSPFGDEEHS